MSYPKSREKLHYQELRKFTLSIGMPRDALVKFIQPSSKIDGDIYFSMASLYNMLDNKSANQVLHRTFNVYSAEYNTQVLRKALQLLINRVITFTELQELRTLFETFESEDLEGMPATEHTILRVLKHCGRCIAPLKLQHQLKKMRDQVDRIGRLQFYEFLDIIPHTTYISDVEIPTQLNTGTVKDSQSLYKVDNFYKFLYTNDEKVKHQLDKEYKALISRAIFSDPSPKKERKMAIIQNSKQKELVHESRASYETLKNALRHSNNIVSLSRSGRANIENDSGASLKEKEDKTPPSTPVTSDPFSSLKTPNKLLEPLIVDKDIVRQAALMEELQWEMLNNEEKYKHSIKKTIDDMALRRKFRDRTIFSQPLSNPNRRTAEMMSKASRASSATEAFDFFSTFEEDASLATKATSSGTIDCVPTDTENESKEAPIFHDLTHDPDYQARKQMLLEKVKLIQQGNRLVDL